MLAPCREQPIPNTDSTDSQERQGLGTNPKKVVSEVQGYGQ